MFNIGIPPLICGSPYPKSTMSMVQVNNTLVIDTAMRYARMSDETYALDVITEKSLSKFTDGCDWGDAMDMVYCDSFIHKLTTIETTFMNMMDSNNIVLGLPMMSVIVSNLVLTNKLIIYDKDDYII